MSIIDKLPIEEVLEYEVAGSWWACYISAGFLQELVCKYMVWKVKIKLKRYKKFLYIRHRMELKKALYQN
jgi:hypothetical protein